MTSKETSKLRTTGPLRRETNVDRWIPSQGASDAGIVSILWRHHGQEANCGYQFRSMILSWRCHTFPVTNPLSGIPPSLVDCWFPLAPWWRHQMEKFSALLAFVRGIHRSPVTSPHKGQWRRALMFSLICVWINGWVHNREAGDLRRNQAHYDVIVMTMSQWSGALRVSLKIAWTNCWRNNKIACVDVRRLSGHVTYKLI